jgi:cytochrome c-type biogenesis protein
MSTANVTYLAAFGGGIISFASPCVLPLVPAYLSIVTGLEASEVQRGAREHLARVARDTGLFVIGFSAVFVMLGLSATTVGRTVFRNKVLLTRASGVVVVAMALFLLGSLVLRSPWLYQERRFHPSPSRRPS